MTTQLVATVIGPMHGEWNTTGDNHGSRVQSRVLAGERGTSAVELAIVAPLFFLLLIGFLQFSIWSFGYALGQFGGARACRAGALNYQASRSADPLSGGDTGAAFAAAEAEGSRILSIVSFGGGAQVIPGVIESGIGKGVEGERLFAVHIIMPLPQALSSFGSLTYDRTTVCRLERYYSY